MYSLIMLRFFSVFFVAIFIWGCDSSLKEDTSLAVSTKRIALTYDDAPVGTGPVFSGTERTKALIEQLTLAKTGPAAFFVTTKGFVHSEGQKRVAAYGAAGHLIANHSDQHMWASRTATNDYIADIDVAEAKLEGFPNRRPWFRFPYLDEGGRGKANSNLVKRDELRQALKLRNLMSGYVTVDTYDWHLNTLWKRAIRSGKTVDMKALSKIYSDMVLDAANHYDALGQQVLQRRPAQILLLHENDLAASFTVDLVRALRADGWDIIHPDEAYADPIALTLPQTPFSGMGRISAIASEAGLKGPEVFNHWSASEKGIEVRVAQANVFMPENAPN